MWRDRVGNIKTNREFYEDNFTKKKMKAWHIWDFPDMVYIYFNDKFREEFFDVLFRKCGGKRPCARFFGVNQQTIKQYYRGYRCTKER